MYKYTPVWAEKLDEKHKMPKLIFSIFISKADITAFIQHSFHKLPRYNLCIVTKPRHVFTESKTQDKFTSIYLFYTILIFSGQFTQSITQEFAFVH